MPRKQWIFIGSDIPEDTRRVLKERIERHAVKKWQGRYREISLRFRGKFAYIDVFEPLSKYTKSYVKDKERLKVIEATPTKLCRLRYSGDPDKWEFAFYKYSDGCYELCYLPSGSFFGRPEECFDTAAKVYLDHKKI
ncbi:MAG: hypothetical protein HY929_09300 [Euryarchaeota archaeon]|nr:hypothetical protein [Euryarchaeota archaeon]